jgi:ABC-type branched-subunit amino acid transport system ATPase component
MTSIAERQGLHATGVNISFGGVKALNDVHLDLSPGVWTGLIGPNGSGKTTLLNILSGVYTPDSGQLAINGVELGSVGVSGRSRAGIVRTFQHPQLADTLTLEENVRLGLDLRARRGLGSLDRGAGSRAVADQLERFGCATYARHLPAQAPYGARKMAELARAAVAKPAVLLLDEPAAGLSRQERLELVAALQSMQATEPEMAACLVEHDVGLVAAVCRRMQALNFGRVIAVGSSDEVLADPEVREAYLGRGNNTRGVEVADS